MDNEDYSPGDQFDAEDWWISGSAYYLQSYTLNRSATERERDYFASTWNDKTKKKKQASKDKHYSFTVRNRNTLHYFG